MRRPAPSMASGKAQAKSRGDSRLPDQYLHDVLGLVRLTARPRVFRGRRREFLSESRMPEIGPSGSMSGEWKRGSSHRATPRLYSVQISFRPPGPSTRRQPQDKLLGAAGQSASRVCLRRSDRPGTREAVIKLAGCPRVLRLIPRLAIEALVFVIHAASFSEGGLHSVELGPSQIDQAARVLIIRRRGGNGWLS